MFADVGGEGVDLCCLLFCVFFFFCFFFFFILFCHFERGEGGGNQRLKMWVWVWVWVSGFCIMELYKSVCWILRTMAKFYSSKPWGWFYCVDSYLFFFCF